MASSDSEDEDLKTAIAMSLATHEASRSADASVDDSIMPKSINAAGDVATPIPSASLSSLAGLDRRAMEADRLARLARKRERSISPPPTAKSRKSQKVEETTVSLPSGAMLKSFSTVVNQDQLKRKSEAANSANQKLKTASSISTVKREPGDDSRLETVAEAQGALRYPHGVVKKTWAFGFERTGNDIKLEEVLEPQTLRTAVLSAFQWDMDWVLAKLKTPETGGSTKCVFIMQAETNELRQQMLRQTEPARAWLRLCFPPMYTPIHCMHSKLMLLFHPDKLRIAIPTANLLNFDWGETGVMENSVFMIDLPRLPNGGKTEVEGMTALGKELLYFLRRQQLDRDVRDGVLNFDFSATHGMAFIHTVGGSHFEEEAERTGILGLARAVHQLDLESQDGLEIDFAASSIGSLNDDYLKSVHAAARGEDMVKRAESISSTAKAGFFKTAAAKSSDTGIGIRNQLRIYFPTHNTVTSSIAGSAGTICLNRKWFESGAFPRTCFRDYRSTRTGLLSHNKILYARGHKKDPNELKKNVAWAYVGSANMSESAWGKLSYDKKERAWKIVCRNWECGVLLPVPAEKLAECEEDTPSLVKKEKVEGEDSETESEDDGTANDGNASSAQLVGIEVFKDVVEPPFEIPGARYGGQQPWYFMERQQ